jgi:hypothetical protein
MTVPVYNDDDGNSGRATPCEATTTMTSASSLGGGLNPIGYRNAAQFTAHTYDYYIVKSAEPLQWPNR